MVKEEGSRSSGLFRKGVPGGKPFSVLLTLEIMPAEDGFTLRPLLDGGCWIEAQ
jgi:hypothetical protein